jgi:hypothetical protein
MNVQLSDKEISASTGPEASNNSQAISPLKRFYVLLGKIDAIITRTLAIAVKMPRSDETIVWECNLFYVVRHIEW